MCATKTRTRICKNKPNEKESEEVVDFEEVEEDFLELPDTAPEPQPQKNSGNEYDNMFQ